ncbi:MAG: fucose isomerase [Kiritimatiellaeota bacterium]|nr:fucose isomerase [Kiritimatiellota bacterium]
MKNTPSIKLGIVAVSRDCFPIELSRKRLARVLAAVEEKGLELIPGETIIESENDVLKALVELESKGVDAVVVYLGNFGPEGPTTLFIQKFDGPAMVCAAAEETAEDLFGARGDAYCGMLNCSYNLALRNLRAHIPESPVGLPSEIADEIERFAKIARVVVGLKKLKVLSFGPRPQDFFACNAPIKPLFDIGVEVMENSELDLFEIFKAAEGNSDVADIAAEMAKELGGGNTYPDMLNSLAQYESALKRFLEENLGASGFAVFANKCWPAFESAFGFVPCYVNSRMAASGVPVACEVDIYGAVSEYMAQLAGGETATILDINNTVPSDLIADSSKLEGFSSGDLFMGFHCGNTAKNMLCDGCAIKYQLIMNRLMEGGAEPDITRGTLEGTLKAGDATIFRLQATPEAELRSYLAEGRVLDVDPRSFGAIGVVAVRNMSRFYRHVLIDGNYPHHTALTLTHAGGVLFDAMKLATGISPSYPLPPSIPYPGENPFS